MYDLFITEKGASEFEEYLKPHFSEPPLYVPSVDLSEEQQQLLQKFKLAWGAPVFLVRT